MKLTGVDATGGVHQLEAGVDEADGYRQGRQGPQLHRQVSTPTV